MCHATLCLSHICEWTDVETISWSVYLCFICKLKFFLVATVHSVYTIWVTFITKWKKNPNIYVHHHVFVAITVIQNKLMHHFSNGISKIFVECTRKIQNNRMYTSRNLLWFVLYALKCEIMFIYCPRHFLMRSPLWF